ncbi:hypothetical protein SKTS_04420 [Sulfurimicrobium lacus]|uniref:Type IV pilus biogenesis protein PilP n=1 Tax=Sulfurimicrobium lacus TaxID=2715678 RepID=A0A6F8V981_9PROT|nr:hypothetical protein [Sulfurimicrobium lacus]BCB25556.1 hypothetical protein SKTS_04420 [Sulfurimicrobium lacus]
MRRDTTKIIAVFLLLLPSLGMAAEQSLGRLFFTPEQRARMDVARQQERSIKIDTDQQESGPPVANITLNGVVTRSDGKSTVWINNREQSGDKAISGIAVPKQGKAAGQVSITTPDAKRSIPLKVGQSIDLNSGQVEESYRRTPPQPDKKEAPPSSTPDRLPASPAKPLPRGGDAQDAPEPADAQGAMPLSR